MPKFVIERHMPGVGKLARPEVVGASKGSNEALAKLGKQIQWVHSYVTGDKIYCVYLAVSEDLLREHAERTGLPADKISEVRAIIDPTMAAAGAAAVA